MSSAAPPQHGDELLTPTPKRTKFVPFFQVAKKPKRSVEEPLRRKLTHMGKFTIITEKRTNLSICTALVVLEKVAQADLMPKLRTLLHEKLIKQHFRFRCKVSKDYVYYHEVPNLEVDDHIRHIHLQDFQGTKAEDTKNITLIEESEDEGDETDDKEVEDEKQKNQTKEANSHSDDEEDEEVTLRKCISALSNQPLDLERPLWEVIVVHGYSKGTALFFRIHHSIGDGTSLGILFSQLCDNPPSFEEPKKKKSFLYQLCEFPILLCQKYIFILWILLGLVKVAVKWIFELFKGKDPKTCFAGQLSNNKKVAWSSDFVSVEECSAIGKPYKATINDVMLAVAAGAMDRYMEQKGVAPSKPTSVRIAIPVNIRTSMEQMKTIGNMFGFMVARLPIGVKDPKKRIGIIKAEMDRNKGIPEPWLAYYGSYLVNFLPSFVVALAFSRLSQYLTLVMTNVRGYNKELTMLDGKKVNSLIGFVPPPNGVGFGMAVMSYNNKLSISILSDENLVSDPEEFIDLFKKEYVKYKEVTLGSQ